MREPATSVSNLKPATSANVTPAGQARQVNAVRNRSGSAEQSAQPTLFRFADIAVRDRWRPRDGRRAAGNG
jgi:hypothetical protein